MEKQFSYRPLAEVHAQSKIDLFSLLEIRERIEKVLGGESRLLTALDQNIACAYDFEKKLRIMLFGNKKTIDNSMTCAVSNLAKKNVARFL